MVSEAHPGAAIAGIGVAFPPRILQDDLWEGYFAERFEGDRVARAAFRNAGVTSRHAVVDPRLEDLSLAPTSARMARFVAEAPHLSVLAANEALERAGTAPEEVGLLVVVSCTGYATPGLDIALAHALGLRPDLERLLVGHLGCHAALPALNTAADYATSHGAPALVVSCELASLHIQEVRRGPRHSPAAAAHALFGDAAAAALVTPRPSRGFRILDRCSLSATEHAGLLRWELTERGFAMELSRELPLVIARLARDLVAELLERNDLDANKVGAWAVHPGGPRVLDLVEGATGLAPSTLAPSRAVLEARGNCSSATVLIVLEELAGQHLAPGERVVALAFGPGITGAALLLEAV